MAGSPPVFVVFLFTSPLVVCMDPEGAKVCISLLFIVHLTIYRTL